MCVFTSTQTWVATLTMHAPGDVAGLGRRRDHRHHDGRRSRRASRGVRGAPVAPQVATTSLWRPERKSRPRLSTSLILSLMSGIGRQALRPGRRQPGAALDLLEHSLDAGATLIAIGPYTNLALLEITRAGSLNRQPVVVMGGCAACARPTAVGTGHGLQHTMGQTSR